MPVNFAAVHDQKRWRKHRIHQSLQAAIEGSDGAKNLLRRIGRVAGMWRKYGDVQCVFVWGDGAENGQAFRLTPNGGGTIQAENVMVYRILEFDKKRDCSIQEIAECFRVDAPAEPGQQPNSTPCNGSTVPLNGESIYPDDLVGDRSYVEGLAQQVLVNRYERSIEARKACIEHYKCVCQVCRINFTQRYGSVGIGFIHVHHRVPIATIGGDYRVDPIKDLVPVCPNCHAMLHRREPPLEIEELQGMLNAG